jgi:nucleoside-diphosphate-sugar epimerase
MLGRPDLKPVYELERAGDIKHSYADVERARSALGYEPIVSFEEGLHPTLEWYREVLA